MLTSERADLQSERGSLPLALLATMVVSAVVAMVMAGVLAGEEQTRFDASYEVAVQTAEVGTGLFISRLKNNVPMAQCSGAEVNSRCFTGTANGGTYSVRADRDTTDNWTIVSTATVHGVARRVRVRLERQQPFRHAMFGDKAITFTGSSRQARSFNSITETWSTGNATLATNTSNLQTDTTVVFDNKPGETNVNIDVSSDEAVAFIMDEIQGCLDNGTFISGTYKLTGSEVAPQTICAQNLEVVPGDVVNLHSTATQANPMRIFLTGGITFGRASSTNCGIALAKCTWGAVAPNFPKPGALQIYTIGEGQVFFHTDARVSAAIYAPRAHCLSSPHANIYGSLVCRVAGSFTGHFRLYYDDALKNVYGPERRIWSEEPSA